jgi:HlyD family secretion protein
MKFRSDAQWAPARSGTEQHLLQVIVKDGAGLTRAADDSIPAARPRRISVASIGLAALALNSCGQKPAPASEAEPKSAGATQSMRVVRVAVRDLTDQIIATGRLVVREEAAVGSELMGYRVQSVMVDEGDWVKQGQALAKMDDTLLRAQIAQAEATLAQQEASAVFKKSQFDRANSLTEAGAFSKELLEQRRMEAMSADAAVLAARASVQEMKAREARMTLRAPVAGRILQRSLRPGDISSSGAATPYFRIARDGLVELDAELPDARLAALKIGDKAHVALPSGEVFEGKVRFISPRVDQATGLGRARIELPFDERLRPGGFAEANFDGVASELLAVPASAIRYESGGPVVMMVGEGNKVVRVPVKLGERSGEFVQLVEGPPAGSLVLATGSAFTLEGDIVEPVEEEPAPAAAAAPAESGK